MNMVWGTGPPCRPGRPARFCFLRGPARRPPPGSIHGARDPLNDLKKEITNEHAANRNLMKYMDSDIKHITPIDTNSESMGKPFKSLCFCSWCVCFVFCRARKFAEPRGCAADF